MLGWRRRLKSNMNTLGYTIKTYFKMLQWIENNFGIHVLKSILLTNSSPRVNFVVKTLKCFKLQYLQPGVAPGIPLHRD